LLNLNDHRLYFGMVCENCSPNWNNQCELFTRPVDLATIGRSLCASADDIYMIEESFASILNQIDAENKDYSDYITAPDTDGMYKVTIMDDSNSSRLTVTGRTKDDVFRKIANEYQGRRNFRRPDVPEYKIVDPHTFAAYIDWKRTAKGLVSDFDKFYGGGIVD